MPFDFQRARPLLQTGNLAQLFVEELGWEPSRQKLTLRAAETDHAFTAIAEKRGFTAWLCIRADGHLPDHTTRLKLDRALTQTSFEHLIVFATHDGAQQSWVWVRREPGRPLSARTHEFNRSQPGDSLLQKLQTLFVSLEEEEQGELSTITIAERARAAFDIERVTKAFYRDFDTHRKAFLKFIDGIGEVADREWYASVMQMGAYYTKEDITEYISKSTVIPFLFDAARTRCKIAFDNPNGPTIWSLLSADPDRYIYPAVRHGVRLPFPDEIALGLDPNAPHLIARRKPWNKPAPPEYGLPTETWREVVARRSHYDYCWWRLMGLPITPTSHPAKVGTGLLPPDSGSNGGNGERAMPSPAPPRRADSASSAADEASASSAITDINDFITLNLDLRQFAQDVIETSEGPDLLMAFWQAITTITVLDPTGGSGAFIFAALNILEPLYEACLDRMEAFLAEWGDQGKKLHPNYHKKFTEVLARVDAHPNRRYFVLKSIILNNLYAVDIMEEAVEICKLRLFLKLAAQVEPDAGRDNFGIEPLPDIDFNIRAGNTLVGYSTKQEVQRCMKEVGGGQMKLLDEADLGSFARFNTRCADVEQAFAKFRQLQTEGDGSVPYADKLELQKRLRTLEEELNSHLASDYGVKVSDKAAYTTWLKSHQPFHWFIQFYGILARGGFDVIIGNPPYVEYSKVSSTYRLPQNVFSTESCGNLYAFVCERIQKVTRPGGRSGVIVLLASLGTVRMLPLQTVYRATSELLVASHYEATSHPSVLFVGVEAQLSIIFSRAKLETKHSTPRCFTSNYIRTYSIERDLLFERVELFEMPTSLWESRMPRLSDPLELSILRKLRAHTAAWQRETGGETLLYRSMGNFFWKLAFTKPPRFEIDDVQVRSSTLAEFKVPQPREATMGLIYSSLFYWWWVIWSDVYHLTKADIQSFPWDPHAMDKNLAQAIVQQAKLVQAELFKTAKLGDYERKNGRYVFHRFFPHQTKPLIDQIDTVLAQHYGFTDEELDFILNYDIKYRLGRDTETEED